jgi:hypothetical protein
MESYAELYEHISTRTAVTPAGETTRWMDSSYLGVGPTLGQGWNAVHNTDVSGSTMLKARGKRYRHAGLFPHRLLFASDRDDLCSLWVRDRKGSKESAARWVLAAARGEYAETLAVVRRMNDWVLVRVTDRQERRHERTTLLRAVAWVPVHVLYYGVELEYIHELTSHRADVVGLAQYSYSPRKSALTPHVFVWDTNWGGTPISTDKPRFLQRGWREERDNFVAPELQGEDWKDHCEVRHVAMTTRVRVQTINGTTTSVADGYQPVYPVRFLGETNSRVGTVLTDTRDIAAVSHSMVAPPEAQGALDLLERERVRRDALFSDLAAAVFNPARLERMMAAYGDDWMERV